jgi:hypothetical protein
MDILAVLGQQVVPAVGLNNTRLPKGNHPMKIHVEVTQADLDEALADDLQDFEQMLRHQLDEGVSTNDGGNGTDWMPKYELVIKLV